MSERLLQQFKDVLVVDGIEDETAGPPRANQAHTAKQPELMRHCGLADPDKRRNVADAQLPGGDGVEDADPGRITKNAKCLCKRFDGAGRHEVLPARQRAPWIQMRRLAGIILWRRRDESG
jgi:hypothetical protein